MRRHLRTALSLLAVVGLVIAVWPLGQVAYGRWSQYSLQAAWRKKAQESQHRSTSKGQKPKDKRSTILVNSAGAPAKTAAKDTEMVPEWPPTRIIIPEIDLDAVVVQGWDEGALSRGPGHHPQSALPGQSGNCVLAAHRNVYGAWFKRVDALFPGSLIKLRTPDETFTYNVILLYAVADTDNSVLQVPTGQDAAPRLTLITCTLPRSTSRIVVVAELVPPEAQ